MSIKIDISKLSTQLRKIEAKLPTAIQSAMTQTAREAISIAKHNHRFKTRGPNGLQTNTKFIVNSPYSITLIADKPYASYVNFGTRPHLIEALKSKALRFKIGRKTFFAKKVFHPGTKADPFMSNLLPFLQVRLPLQLQMTVNALFGSVK